MCNSRLLWLSHCAFLHALFRHNGSWIPKQPTKGAGILNFSNPPSFLSRVCKLWKQIGGVVAVWRSILWYLLIQLISFCRMGWKGLSFVLCHKDWELNHSVALGSDHVNSAACRQTWAWCLALWWSVLSFRRWNCATFTRSQLKSHWRHFVAFSFDEETDLTGRGESCPVHQLNSAFSHHCLLADVDPWHGALQFSLDS